MLLRKAQAGSAPGYTWDTDGAVVDVEDDLAFDLLDIPGGGFTVAEDSAASVDDQSAEEPPAEAVKTEVSEAPTAKRRGRPSKNTVSSAELGTPVAE